MRNRLWQAGEPERGTANGTWERLNDDPPGPNSCHIGLVAVLGRRLLSAAAVPCLPAEPHWLAETEGFEPSIRLESV